MSNNNAVGIYFVGEAIADQKPDPKDPRSMRVSLGGSMYFGSIGTARVAPEGVRSFYVGPISDDCFGNLMMADYHKHGVGLDYIRRTPFISMIAVVSEDGQGGNKYSFYGRNQMNTTEHLQLDALPESFSEKHRLFCFGSVATTLSPSGETLKTFAMVQKEKDSIILYDPNTRPSVIPDVEVYRESLEDWVQVASIVKASDEDVLFTYPDLTLDEVANRWLELGVKGVFITRGAEGSNVYVRQGTECIPRLVNENIKFTVGAGDNFNAGILAGLSKSKIYTGAQLDMMSLEDWLEVGNTANQTAYKHLLRVNNVLKHQAGQQPKPL